MTAYDDERVIALLHDAVPATPDMPDRVVAVRHRAHRQRTHLWTQSLGAAVAVLLLAGVASAIGSGGGSNTVHPVKDPLRLVADAFTAQRSVRFDVTAVPVGTLPASITPAMRGKLDTHVTGAVTHDGDLQVDGNLGIIALAAFDQIDFHVRIVDGVAYQTIGPGETAPKGKTWIRADGGTSLTADDLRRMLRAAGAFADSVTYLRASTARGVPVAVYRVVIPAKLTHDTPLDLTVAIDADGLPRRIDAEGDITALFGGGPEDPHIRVHLGADLYGYGDDVAITAPPAAEVTTQDKVIDASTARINKALDAERRCFEKAQADGNATQAETKACADAFRKASGGAESGLDSETFSSSATVGGSNMVVTTAVPMSPMPTP
jgi:hypothetical protein